LEIVVSGDLCELVEFLLQRLDLFEGLCGVWNKDQFERSRERGQERSRERGQERERESSREREIRRERPSMPFEMTKGTDLR